LGASGIAAALAAARGGLSVLVSEKAGAGRRNLGGFSGNGVDPGK
jgi:flavin-dependent dehydrogenase